MPPRLDLPNESFAGKVDGLDVAVIASGSDIRAVVVGPTGEVTTLRGRLLGLPTTLVGGAVHDAASPTLTIAAQPDPSKLAVVFRRGDFERRIEATRTADPAAFFVETRRGGTRLTGAWVRHADGSSRGTLTSSDGGRCARTVGEDGTVDLTSCGFVANALPLLAEPIVPGSIAAPRRDGARRFTFLTLGDSYASGEGAPLVDGAYDASGDLTGGAVLWGDARPIGIPPSLLGDQDRARRSAIARACHRSDAAASRIVAAGLAIDYPNVTIVHDLLACSGAEVTEIVSASDAGYEDCELRTGSDRTDCLRISASLPPSAPLPPQLAQVDDFVARFSMVPDALTVSIGGNDAGFSTILSDCISPLTVSGCQAAGSKARAALANGLRILPDRYATLGKAIAARGLARTATFVALYPDALLKDDHGGLCSGADFSAAGDSLLSNIDAEEAKFAHAATHTLDDAIRAAATHEGFLVVDAHVDAAAGHSLCALQDRWIATLPTALRSQGHDVMSPLDFLADFNPFRLSAGMVHPDRAGHRDLYAPALRAALEPLVVAAMTPATPPAALRVESVVAGGSITVAWDDASDIETSYRLRVLRVEGSTGVAMRDDRLPANTLRAVIDLGSEAAFRVEVAACVDAGRGHEQCTDDATLLVSNRLPTTALPPPTITRGVGASVALGSAESVDAAHVFFLFVVDDGTEATRALPTTEPLLWLDALSPGDRIRVASCNDLGCGPLSPETTLR